MIMKRGQIMNTGNIKRREIKKVGQYPNKK